MIPDLSVIRVLLLVALGEARVPNHFLQTDGTEIQLFSEAEETLTVRSSYRRNRPNASYLTVHLEDPALVRAGNVAKSSSDVTVFTVTLVAAGGEGETALTVRLWDPEGGQNNLIEEIPDIKIKVIHDRKAEPLHEALGRFDRYVLMLILPMVLFNKCAFGCKIQWETLRMVWKDPSPVILGAVIQFLVMPFCGFLLTRILALPQEVSFGFLMTCTCPGGGGGYLYALLLKGDTTLAILMTCTSTLLALAMMPINSFGYSRLMGLTGSLHIPVYKITATLLFIVLPVSAGMIVKRSKPEMASYLEKLVRPFSFILMSAGIYLSFRAGLAFLRAASLQVLLLGTLVPSLGLGIGYCSAELLTLPLPARKTVAIESGVLNSFLALAIIQLSFPQPKAHLASVAPFTVAMMTGCEMALILLIYKVRGRKAAGANHTPQKSTFLQCALTRGTM
ncbi:sodium/bile acid cotransporter 5 [Tachyglossus aculeatus]|uniref:sodium/bile acid cotransporter 5 n=1 Tax=Tachyglossus aculeatus TaxID=9261 RepID=UPI0018F64509|nr:sodium/bile acid cotransporter 5 [Tachyglossus aculeatus]